MKTLITLALTILLTASYAEPITYTTDIMVLDLATEILMENRTLGHRVNDKKAIAKDSRRCNTTHVETMVSGSFIAKYCGALDKMLKHEVILEEIYRAYKRQEGDVADLRRIANEYRNHREYSDRFDDYIRVKSTFVKVTALLERARAINIENWVGYRMLFELNAHVTATWYFAHKGHYTHEEGLSAVNKTVPSLTLNGPVTDVEREYAATVYSMLVTITK